MSCSRGVIVNLSKDTLFNILYDWKIGPCLVCSRRLILIVVCIAFNCVMNNKYDMNYGMGHSPSLIIAFLSDIPFDFSESNMSVELSRKPGIYSTNNNQLNEVNIRFRVIRYSYRLSTRNRKVRHEGTNILRASSQSCVPPLRVVCPLSYYCISLWYYYIAKSNIANQ